MPGALWAGGCRTRFALIGQSTRSGTDFAERAEPLADASRDLIRQADHLYKLLSRLVEATKKNGRGSPLKPLEAARKEAVDHLRSPRYFRRQARWLEERFPKAELRDVEGLVKLVGLEELEETDWSLTPGRYVGVAPEEEDEDFDFEETIREIQVELQGLNEEAAELAATCPCKRGGANLFFQLVNARYERGAVILTSNRGFSEWGEVFGDTVVAAALLDRLLHHAIVIEIAGNSYRLRKHAKLVPDSLRLPPVSATAKPKKRRGRPRKKHQNETTKLDKVGKFTSAQLGKITSALTVLDDVGREGWGTVP